MCPAPTSRETPGISESRTVHPWPGQSPSASEQLQSTEVIQRLEKKKKAGKKRSWVGLAYPKSGEKKKKSGDLTARSFARRSCGALGFALRASRAAGRLGLLPEPRQREGSSAAPTPPRESAGSSAALALISCLVEKCVVGLVRRSQYCCNSMEIDSLSDKGPGSLHFPEAARRSGTASPPSARPAMETRVDTKSPFSPLPDRPQEDAFPQLVFPVTYILHNNINPKST